MTHPKRSLPTLLPKNPSYLDSQAGPHSSSVVDTNPTCKRRQVNLACESCKNRKIRCDGVRPQCAPCRKRGSHCLFAAPEGLSLRQAEREQFAKYQAVIQLLREGSFADLAQAAQRIKDSDDVEDAVTSMAQARLLLAPPSSSALCSFRSDRCSNCAERGHTSYVCSETRMRPQNATAVLQLLQSLPEDQAFELFRNIRREGNSSTVSSINRSSDESVHDHLPSAAVIEKSASNPIKLTLMSELTAKAPNAYPPLLPIVPSILARSSLLQPVSDVSTDGNARRSSFLHHTQTGTGNIDRGDAGALDADSVLGHFRMSTASPSIPHYEDERLRSVDISFWTNLSITDSFAAKVISLYLKTDHPLMGLFDADLFLNDLIDQQTNFCSKFLVHALLSLGCQMYGTFEKTAISMADRFGKEAEGLWQAERQHDSYPTMAGAIMLSLSHIGQGIDNSALEYSKAAADMGLRLGLFDVDKNVATPSDLKQGGQQIRARCFAAWGLFNWNTFVSLFYRQPGVIGLKRIPALPIPGESILLSNSGISCTEAPQRDTLMGTTFPVLCNFWRIIHGIMWIYYPDQHSPPDSLRLELAEHKFRELLAWIEELPPSMLRDNTCPHHVAVFHIWLHSAILDIFRPFLRHISHDCSRLKTFSASDSNPEAVYGASVNQLKRLIFDYRTNYETSTYSILWHTGLLYLANAVLQDTNNSQWRLYFLLCIYGYESLKRPYRISEVIVRGLLSMTLRDTNMPANDARKLLKQMEKLDLDQATPRAKHSIRATFMVDLILALKDPEKANAENMAADFEVMALFQDLLDQDTMTS